MEPAGICKDGDPSKQPEGHEEAQKDTAQPGVFRIGKERQDIHGDTAELKGEIPPLIGTMIQNKRQTCLLPDLREKHEKPADQKKAAEAERGAGRCCKSRIHNKSPVCMCFP